MSQWFVDVLPFLPHLLAAGIGAGFLAGLFGIGGGLIVVPALFTLLQYKGMSAPVAMAMALATSLASIVPTALSSLRSHHQLHNIRWDIVRIWCLPLIVGVILGGALIAILRSRYFIIYFALFLAIIAIYSLLKSHDSLLSTSLPSLVVQACMAFILGFLSVIAGVGGGSLGVPLLKKIGASTHQAIGTCSVLGLCVALPGTLSVLLLSSAPHDAPNGTISLIYVPALVFMSPFAVLCAPIGARVGKKIPAILLLRLFAIFLLLIAIKMLWSGLTA